MSADVASVPITFENGPDIPFWRFTDSDGWTPQLGECVDTGSGWFQRASGRFGSWWSTCLPPAAPGGVGVDPRELAMQLFRDAPIAPLRVSVNPNPGLVQVPNWFWISGGLSGPLGLSGTLEIPPEVGDDVPLTVVPADSPRRRPTTRTVEVEVRSAGYVWDFGDGTAPQLVGSRGQAFPQASEVAHVYRFSSFYTRGGFPITVQARYVASFRVDGGAWESLGSQSWAPEVYRHPVQEIQTVIGVAQGAALRRRRG